MIWDMAGRGHDISSNQQKVKLMSVQTKVLRWHLKKKVLMEVFDSLESLMQTKKGGIRNQPYLER